MRVFIIVLIILIVLIDEWQNKLFKQNAGIGESAFGLCKLETGINSAVAAPHKMTDEHTVIQHGNTGYLSNKSNWLVSKAHSILKSIVTSLLIKGESSTKHRQITMGDEMDDP